MSRDAVAQDASFPMAAVDHPVAHSQKAPVASPIPTKPASVWNTKDLGLRLGVDVASAASAGALTCPLITIIDRFVFSSSHRQSQQ